MPEIQDILTSDILDRRGTLVNDLRLTNTTFSADDLSPPLPTYRNRVANEALEEYRQLEFAYYESILEGRYVDYLSSIEREMLKQYDFGGIAEVVAVSNLGWFDLPEEIIQFDLYDIQTNAAMKDLLEIGIPNDVDALAMADFLEKSAWRTAGESASRLSGTVDDSIARLVNTGMQAHVEVPGFGRADFVKLLSEPLDGNPAPMSESRARMIARTEATRARNAATEDLANAMRAQGYQIVEIWRIAQNTNVCPDCEAREGTVRGTVWIDYPPLHPNCDCDVEVETLEVIQ